MIDRPESGKAMIRTIWRTNSEYWRCGKSDSVASWVGCDVVQRITTPNRTFASVSPAGDKERRSLVAYG
jgi:hypothetical protein